MLLPKARSGRPTIAIASLMIIALGSGCNDQRNQPECGDVYKSRLDQTEFEVFDGGMALHKPTGLTVTQCAGSAYVQLPVQGGVFETELDEGWPAAEVAEKTGEPGAYPRKMRFLIFWRIDD